MATTDAEIRRGMLCLLGNVRKAEGEENKLTVVTHLFQHFCQHADVRAFIGRHQELRETIRWKLRELFLCQGIRRARDWYAALFREDMAPDFRSSYI
jgi:hypothetical protein